MKALIAKLQSLRMLWNSVTIFVSEQLVTVSVEVMSYVEASYRIRHVLRIDCKLLPTNPRALQKITGQTIRPRAIIWRLECLRASGVMRVKSLQIVLFDAELISKYIDKYSTGDRVKRRAKVQRQLS